MSATMFCATIKDEMDRDEPIVLPIPEGVTVKRKEITFPDRKTAVSFMMRIRAAFSTGRPLVKSPCRWCRRKFSARVKREHEPRCPKNPHPVEEGEA